MSRAPEVGRWSIPPREMAPASCAGFREVISSCSQAPLGNALPPSSAWLKYPGAQAPVGEAGASRQCVPKRELGNERL